MSRLGLTQIPLRDAKHLWRDLHVVNAYKDNGKSKTDRIYLKIIVEGENDGKKWECGLEFYHANSESFYCRPIKIGDSEGGGNGILVPDVARSINIALLPPLSGLSSEEPELQPGRISVLLGEGRSGEVLRNLCLRVWEADTGNWNKIRQYLKQMFHIEIGDPVRDSVRGVIDLFYKERGVELDITSAGRGFQQVLLLLSHMISNPGSIILLDEPDAHLEVIRQREVYSVITGVARDYGNQLLIASHSEIVMQDAADRDLLISFVGQPRRVDDRGSQVAKSLKHIRADDYYQADRRGFVLYLEGSTDLSIIMQIADLVNHPVSELLKDPFVYYVGNVATKVSEHFFGLRSAIPGLKAFALFDKLDRSLPDGFAVPSHVWRRREIENYIATKEILMRFAAQGNLSDLVERAQSLAQQEAMRQAISDIEGALKTLRKNPWDDNIKMSDEVLSPLFASYYEKLNISNRINKTNYHVLVGAMRPNDVHEEFIEALDKIYKYLK